MEFTKLQAAGNDFILVDGIKYKNLDMSTLAKKVCDRHFGIGADGLMVCEESKLADIKMTYFNSDGSFGAMCGNGIRCFSKFVYDKKIVTKREFSVETKAGIKTIHMSFDGDSLEHISVDMERPDFRAKSVPANWKDEFLLDEEIEVLGEKIKISAVLMGVPHVVIFVEDIEKIDVNKMGKIIENREDIFPQKANINFIQILDDKTLRIKTWERGAGRTLGCGTGCCAAGSVAHKLGKIESTSLKFINDGGEVFIDFDSDYNVKMRGKAHTICNGDYILKGERYE